MASGATQHRDRDAARAHERDQPRRSRSACCDSPGEQPRVGVRRRRTGPGRRGSLVIRMTRRDPGASVFCEMRKSEWRTIELRIRFPHSQPRSVASQQPLDEDSHEHPSYGPGVEITGRITPEYAQILTPEAVAFVAKLQRAFGGRRNELLARRAARQAEFDAGKLPDFLPETRAVREGAWTCAPVPADIQDRRVEITGPVDRKMIVNALNSGANVFMADFEDANTPTLGQQDPGPHQPARRDPPPHRFHVARGQGVQAQRQDRRAVRAPARLAPAGEARHDRRPAGLGRHLRLRRSTSSTTRRSSSRAAAGRTSTCRSSRAISRRGCGTTSS